MLNFFIFYFLHTLTLNCFIGKEDEKKTYNKTGYFNNNKNKMN